ncbi:uncharacterized protein B0P05DRAFT_583733 [Gilbertella persicaria]|uniref:uncharacterized protein n=1 Tax=Gilbertella persicaria TaxID=101096 RepID=UPI00221FFAFA|nr:uncharacterized protein B0P05DRAFT_583733 [Gilbertella persicaria]KAI8091208.1 hypothetical protein B0P05DRAFT_583733 [Gilbertella persicaria]
MSLQLENVTDTHKKHKLDLETEEDCHACTICSENWDAKGDHCLVSLKCGHLFGKKCIVRWIIDRSKKLGGSKAPCPMCMKAARQSDIRIVLPTRIAVKDTTQSDLLKQELETLRVQIKENEKELELSRLGLNLRKRELEKAKRNMSLPLLPSLPSTVTMIPKLNQLPYTISNSKRLSDTRHVARVMALNSHTNTACISFKSSNAHGLLKLDLTTMKQTEFMPVHNSLIRDVRYTNDCVLSTSLDKTLQLTSTQSELTVNLPMPGWSCCAEENLLLSGLADSKVMVYDRRFATEPLKIFSHPTAQKTPLHSLFMTTIDNRPIVCCANLTQAFLYDFDTSQSTLIESDFQEFKPYSLTLHADKKDIVLLSSRSPTSTRHTLHQIKPDLVVPEISCFVVPQPQKSLTRTLAYSGPEGEDVIGYSQEEKGALHLQQSDKQLQQFQIHSCPLDIQSFHNKLAFLTDNRFFLLEPKPIKGRDSL